MTTAHFHTLRMLIYRKVHYDAIQSPCHKDMTEGVGGVIRQGGGEDGGGRDMIVVVDVG